MRMLAVIPARGGSKGLHRKGLAQVGGRSLIARAFDCTIGNASIARTILSTDDDEYAHHAREIGLDVPWLRPAGLASDSAASIDVFIHAMHQCEADGDVPYDGLLVLQPTSPLRTPKHVQEALALFIARGASHMVSVCPWEHPLNWSVDVDDQQHVRMHPVMANTDLTQGRQTHGVVRRLNGAIYCYRRDFLLTRPTTLAADAIAYEMPAIDSVDIDTADDLALAQALHDAREGRLQ